MGPPDSHGRLVLRARDDGATNSRHGACALRDRAESTRPGAAATRQPVSGIRRWIRGRQHRRHENARFSRELGPLSPHTHHSAVYGCRFRRVTTGCARLLQSSSRTLGRRALHPGQSARRRKCWWLAVPAHVTTPRRFTKTLRKFVRILEFACKLLYSKILNVLSV